MRRASQSVHDRRAKTLLGQGFRDDAIQRGVIELA